MSDISCLHIEIKIAYIYFEFMSEKTLQVLVYSLLNDKPTFACVHF